MILTTVYCNRFTISSFTTRMLLLCSTFYGKGYERFVRIWWNSTEIFSYNNFFFNFILLLFVWIALLLLLSLSLLPSLFLLLLCMYVHMYVCACVCCYCCFRLRLELIDKWQKNTKRERKCCFCALAHAAKTIKTKSKASQKGTAITVGIGNWQAENKRIYYKYMFKQNRTK